MEIGLWNKGLKILLRPRRIINKILQLIARSPLIYPKLRILLQKARGVKFLDTKSVFIGANVYFDELKPENITIGKGVYLTEGVKILAHFFDPHTQIHTMREGKVVIEDNVFLGFNVIIASAVQIGKRAVVGANSVVTRDIKANSIVGGVPAKFIGFRKKDRGN